MNIIWCGGEDIDFKGTVIISTLSGAFHADYARCAVDIGQYTSNCYA